MLHEVSATGHRILVIIMLKKGEGLSFNELRSSPYGINPKTLSYHLRQLCSWGFLDRHVRTVRGGRQYRYTLTTRGGRFLDNPISLNELDRVLMHTLMRILGTDSEVDNQLLGLDLAAAKDKRHRVELSVRLAFGSHARQVDVKWKSDGQKRIFPETIKISS